MNVAQYVHRVVSIRFGETAMLHETQSFHRELKIIDDQGNSITLELFGDKPANLEVHDEQKNV